MINFDYDPDEPRDIVAEIKQFFEHSKEHWFDTPAYREPYVILSREVAEDFFDSGLTFWQYFSDHPEKLPRNIL